MLLLFVFCDSAKFKEGPILINTECHLDCKLDKV